MQDITRYLIILIAINLLMGTVNVILSNGTFSESESNLDSISQDVKDNINQQITSDTGMPTEYTQQTEAGSMEGMGRGVILRIIVEGIKPTPVPQGGYETDVEEQGYKAIGYIRWFMYIMTGILAYLVFFNKKT